MTILLYKGPDVANEIAEAGHPRFEAAIIDRYELPYGFGVRTLVQVRASRVNAARQSRAVSIQQ